MPRFANTNAGVGVGLDDLKPTLSALNLTSTPASIQTASRPASVSSAAPPIDEPPTGTEGHRPRRRWTQEEDAKLIAAVNKFGSQRGPGSQWSKISAGLPGRTNKDCRKRWFHSLDPRVRKGRWSSDEDELLRKLYAELGPQWKAIALRIPGRKDDQVSKRWRDVLAPELTSKKPWSDEEDALLLALLEEKGPKWTAIAEQLPGRSPIACRNRSRKYRKQPPAPGTAHTDVSTPAGRSDSSGQRSSPEQEREDPAWADVDRLLAQHTAAAAQQHPHPHPHSHSHSHSQSHTNHKPPNPNPYHQHSQRHQHQQHQHQQQQHHPHQPQQSHPQTHQNPQNHHNHHQHPQSLHHSNGHPPHTGNPEWRLPDVGVNPVQSIDLAFNFEVTNAPSLPAGLGAAGGVTGSEAAEAGFLEGWLATVSSMPTSASGTSTASSVTATSSALPHVPSTESLTTLSANDTPLQVLYGHSETPVNNMWSLLLALDRGEQSVTVNAQLLRQLIADGPGKLKQQNLSMELS